MINWLRRLFNIFAESPRVNANDNNASDTSVEHTDSEVPVAPPIKVAANSPVVVPAAQVPRQSSSISWIQRDNINASFINWLFDASGNPDIFSNPIEIEIIAALDKIIYSAQSGANLVRRMPGVIPQLLQSLREDFSGAELARKISHDVVLVAAVIRLANSVSFNPSQPTTSIEHAILVLGENGLRQLITSVAFKPIIDLKSGHFTKQIAPRIWDQSERCAVACRALAEYEGGDPFDAFLSGLIQNVGLIVCLNIIDHMADGSQPVGSGNFCNELINRARILSCSISKEWRFPDGVVMAIEEQGANIKQSQLSSIGRILSTADYLSKMDALHSKNRLDAQDPSLTRGLSDHALQCLTKLSELVQAGNVV